MVGLDQFIRERERKDKILCREEKRISQVSHISFEFRRHRRIISSLLRWFSPPHCFRLKVCGHNTAGELEPVIWLLFGLNVADNFKPNKFAPVENPVG